MPAKTQADTVGLTELGKWLDLGKTRIRALVDDGVLPASADGRYPLHECVTRYIGYLRSERSHHTQTAGARAVQDAKRRLIEIQIAEKQRSLISMDEAFALVDEVIGRLRAGLAGLPARLTRDLQLRRHIEDGLNGELARASARLRKEAGAEEAALASHTTGHRRPAGSQRRERARS